MRERPAETLEELTRRATRVVYKAELKGRRGLLQRLTAANAAHFEALLEQKAIFHREDAEALQILLLDEETRKILPPEFFEHPTHWIEAQPPIRSPEKQSSEEGFSGSIGDIYEHEHDADVERVKKIVLNLSSGETRRIVSKRVNPKWEDLHEARIARKAYEMGIPTPRVLAEIMDHGNLYIWFEFIPGIDLADMHYEFGIGYGNQATEKIRAAAKRFLDQQGQARIEQIIVERLQCEELQKRINVYENHLAKQLDVSVEELLAAGKQPKGFLEALHTRALELIPDDEETNRLIQGTESRERETFAWNILFRIIERGLFPRVQSILFSMKFDDDQPEQERRHRFEEQQHLRRLIREGSKRISREIPFVSFKSGMRRAEDLSHEAEMLIYHGIFQDVQQFERQRWELRERYQAAKLNNKDWSEKNVLLGWDEETDRPKRNPDGSYALYVLDWEKWDKQR